MERKPKFKKKFNQRLFLAIKLPLEIRREIGSILTNFDKEARNFSFVEPEQLHLTLKFLGGDISNSSQNSIIETLKPIFSSTPNFKIIVDGLMFGFAKQQISKVLYFNCTKNEELTRLAAEVNYRIKKLDLDDVSFIIEGKKLIFHLTVGRLKHTANKTYKRALIKLIDEIQFKPFEFEADKIYLVRSEMRLNQPKYTDVYTFNLKK